MLVSTCHKGAMMFSRVLYADENVSLQLNWFGFGALLSVNKYGGVRRAHPIQKTFFLNATEALQKLGVSIEPGNPVLSHFFRTYAEALEQHPISGLMWRTILNQTPEQIAEGIVEEVNGK
jgi:hypothetical protein